MTKIWFLLTRKVENFDRKSVKICPMRDDVRIFFECDAMFRFPATTSAGVTTKNTTTVTIVRTKKTSLAARRPVSVISATPSVTNPEIISTERNPDFWMTPLPVGICEGGYCSSVVEHVPHDREVVGSKPAGCWALISFYRFSNVSLIGPSKIANISDFPYFDCMPCIAAWAGTGSNKHRSGP